MSFHRACCCCCSDTACTLCDVGCTPRTMQITIPQVDLVSGCQTCPLGFDPSDSYWNVTGTWPELTVCCEQAASTATYCSWVYDVPFDDVVVNVYDGPACTGTNCYTTDRLQILISIFDVLGTVYVAWECYLYDSTAGTCPANPAAPGGAGFYIASGVVLRSSLTAFCRDGGSIISYDPTALTGCRIGDNDNPIIGTEQVTAVITPCCTA